jgi:hypothetical protein
MFSLPSDQTAKKELPHIYAAALLYLWIFITDRSLPDQIIPAAVRLPDIHLRKIRNQGTYLHRLHICHRLR